MNWILFGQIIFLIFFVSFMIYTIVHSAIEQWKAPYTPSIEHPKE